MARNYRSLTEYAAAITSLSERHHKSDELHIGPYTCSGQGIMRLPSGGLSCLLDRMKFIHHAFPFSKTPSGACVLAKGPIQPALNLLSY